MTILDTSVVINKVKSKESIKEDIKQLLRWSNILGSSITNTSMEE